MQYRRLEKQRAAERDRVLTELRDVKSSLDDTYRLFDLTLDPALVEAYIYEMNALRSRYDHLLRSAKTMFL